MTLRLRARGRDGRGDGMGSGCGVGTGARSRLDRRGGRSLRVRTSGRRDRAAVEGPPERAAHACAGCGSNVDRSDAGAEGRGARGPPSVATDDVGSERTGARRGRPAAAARSIAVAELPYFRFHPWGVERRRAEVVRAVCARAASLEALAEVPFDEARVAGFKRCRASARGRQPRSCGCRSAIPMRCRWATTTCRTSSRGRSPASRAAPTSGCWSSSSRTEGSERGFRCSWNGATSPRPRTDLGWKPARSSSSRIRLEACTKTRPSSTFTS